MPVPPSSAGTQLVPPGCPLTPAELDIMRLLARGLVYKQIAQRTGRSTSTVRTHLHGAYVKLRVGDRAQAVIACERAGWLAWHHTPEPVVEVDTQDPAITPTQREYLRAFHVLLRSHDGQTSIAARNRMSGLVDSMFRERDLIPPSLRRDRSPQQIGSGPRPPLG